MDLRRDKTAAPPLRPKTLPIRGLLCGLVLAALGLGPAALGLRAAEPAANAPRAAEAEPAAYRLGVVIRFSGPITPLSEHYVYRKLSAAQSAGADLVIIEIDSPGGHLEPSLNLAVRLRDLEWAHTVAYVPREALSGAAIMALGCDEIVMSPRALLGDAGPIFMGEDFLFRHAPEKVRSDLARRVRDLAEAKGRPPALAEAMVDMDLVVHRVRHRTTGRVWFMSDAEIASAAQPAQWEKLEPVHESRAGHFLEVNGRRAVELRLAEATVADFDELQSRFTLDEPLHIYRPSAVDTVVYVLNWRIVTALLLLVGLIALYVEFSAPGIGLGGLVACLCFGLFFWSRFLGGTAGWLGVVLFAVGLAFLAVELFILPGFGIAGLSGLLLIFASVVLASQDFIVPSTPRQLDTLARNLLAIVLTGGVFVAVAVVLHRRFGTLPVLGRLMLVPPDFSRAARSESGALVDRSSAASGVEETALAVGDLGEAVSPLRPAGKARFGHRLADVVTDGEFIDAQRPVEIVEMSGYRVVVRQVQQRS